MPSSKPHRKPRVYPPKQKKINGYYYWVQAYTKHNAQTTHYIGKKLVQSKVLTIEDVLSRD